MDDEIIFLDKFIKKEVFFIKESENYNEIKEIFKDCLIEEDKNDFNSERILIISQIKKQIHIVKPNDTLQGISLKYNISIDEIKKKNSDIKLFIGKQLYL